MFRVATLLVAFASAAASDAICPTGQCAVDEQEETGMLQARASMTQVMKIKKDDPCPGINTGLTYITDAEECTKPGAPVCCFENTTCRYCGDACTGADVDCDAAALPQKKARVSQKVKKDDPCPGINTGLTYITDADECTKPGAPVCCFENTTCRYCGDACTGADVDCDAAALPQKKARVSQKVKKDDPCPGINPSLTYITDADECTKPGAPVCCFENTTCRYCGDACTGAEVDC